MLKASSEAYLPEKPLGAEGGGELGAEHFQGDGAVVLEIVRAVDDRHPTAAKRAVDAVAAAEGGRQVGDRVVQQRGPVRRCIKSTVR
jgi:hypothetical protein